MISIDVKGLTGSGKTHITYLLSDFLKEKGFQVMINSDDLPPKDATYERALTLIAGKHSIAINEIPFKRGSA